MSTLSVMKARIADELVRSDLTGMIAYAISDAIAAYQAERLFFNETRDITFDTASAQEFYDSNDHASIPDLHSIDYVKIAVGDILLDLRREDPEALEVIQPQSGQPNSYTYYNQQIRLYPVPNDAWEVRVAAHTSVDEPSSDTDKYNAWMTYGERLIRARAKYELAVNVNASGMEPGFSKDAEAKFWSQAESLFNELKRRTSKQTGTGYIKSY